MKRLILFFALFFCLITSISFAAIFQNDEDFSQWVMHYYQKPEPEKISSVIEYYSDSKMFFDFPNSRDMTCIFLAYIFKNDSKSMQKVFDDIAVSKSENAKLLFLNTLWYTDNFESHELIKRATGQWQFKEMDQFKEFLNTSFPPQPLVVKPTSLVEIDMLWSIFFATGDEKAINQIIGVLEGKGSTDLNLSRFAEAAQWSLSVNASQHEKVMKICKAALVKAKGQSKVALQEIVKGK